MEMVKIGFIEVTAKDERNKISIDTCSVQAVRCSSYGGSVIYLSGGNEFYVEDSYEVIQTKLMKMWNS